MAIAMFPWPNLIVQPPVIHVQRMDVLILCQHSYTVVELIIVEPLHRCLLQTLPLIANFQKLTQRVVKHVETVLDEDIFDLMLLYF